MKSTPNAQPAKTGYVNRTKVKGFLRSNALAKTSCQFPDHLPVLLTPPLLSTSNPAAFVSSSPYQGKSIVFTGNHTPLSISDIGMISFSSRSGNVLHLNEAMLVPKVLILFLIRNSGTS
ncbi:unnamed protein product [Cochlearia groenlandica]